MITLAASQLPQWLQASAERSRGEFVLVLHALAPQQPADVADPLDAALHAPCTIEPARLLDLLLAELPLKQAVALAAGISGAPRNALYQFALKRRDAAGGR